MPYFPHTSKEIKEMLDFLGIKSIEELFEDIPKSIREKARKNFKLPEALSEIEIYKKIEEISNKNTGKDYISFLGGGAYYHYIPPVVKHIISYPTFYTSYTPYQAEISQGFLQAMFEYQSLICELTGMEVANSSLYEAGSGIAEASLMAHRINGRKEILISKGVHPEYREVLKTYINGMKLNYKEISLDEKGETDLNILKESLSNETSCLIIQSPNFFGVIETKLKEISELLHQNNSLFICSVYPISLGILKPPGEYKADIVVGEGQCLGSPLNFGGPYLGIFATKREFIRQIPGRLVGETKDLEGKRGYVLTLQTREQHIKRSRATSNICTNEALTALATTVYLSLLGKKGLRKVAELCYDRAHYAKKRLLESINTLELTYPSYFFNEFVIKLNKPVKTVYQALKDKKILAGIPLEKFFPERDKELLLAFTEMNTKEEIDYLVKSMKEALE
ncbi:MAG: aminomethyl-transferring glycine dehydrogenase subunit GcvPA [Dictyoglomus sp.]|nr:aminomethyl-transferring glycine dehydrogenase subunit GcvPA [Dictyoglomus sp.]MCX7941618.1 aminomethyl-transferring glycine dehydrogenase subunit GcvPA [Dictyoglomaceae bacterium]MDW8187763.1 aminomethyl-transferring glycine dehydrogenase subunit GcvPA [Dictyoglomus sp.]